MTVLLGLFTLIISRFPVLDPAASNEGFTVTVTAEGVDPLVGVVVSRSERWRT